MTQHHRHTNIFKDALVVFLVSFFITAPAYSQQTGSIARDTAIFNRSGQQQKNNDVRSLSTDSTTQKDLPTQAVTMPDTSELLLQNISVHVLGDVANPGVRKVKMTERAADVMKLAQPNRSTTRIIQVRSAEGEKKYYDLYQYYFFGNLDHNPYIKENDTIFVPNAKGSIRIEGPVARPGVYEMSYEKHLDQIVRLAGGFTSSLFKACPLKVIRFGDAGEKNVIDVSIQENDLKNFEIRKSDIVIVPDVVNANRRFDYTVETLPGENFIYPTSVPDVFVVGSVMQPGPFPYKSHLLVKDYVGFAGASGDASLRYVSVTHDGKKKRLKLDGKVEAGDIIVVKQKASKDATTYISIASALVSVALSAVVIREYTK